MPITALPDPPTRQDPANFAVRADEFLAALPTFATEANTLATDVNAKQVTASNAATTATTQAGIATTQAGDAATSAGSAYASELAAQSAANSAVAAYDSFDDRYLGSKASDPTLDNDGNALLTGAMYWNSSVGELRFWNGAAWLVANLGAGSYVAKAGDTMTGSLEVNRAASASVADYSLHVKSSGGTSNAGRALLSQGSTYGFTLVPNSTGSTSARLDFQVVTVATGAVESTPISVNYDGSVDFTKITYKEDVVVTSGTFTCVCYKTYVLTATSAPTLPASPAAGDWLKIVNRSGLATITVARNAQNIMGLAENILLDDPNATLTFVFADSTRGWVIA